MGKKKSVLVEIQRTKCILLVHIKITFVMKIFKGSFKYHLCPVKNFRILNDWICVYFKDVLS